MNYKVLFIDWDGTLSNSKFWERWKNDTENHTKYHLLQNALFNSKASEELIIEWMIGSKSYKDVLGFVSEITGIDYSELADELIYSSEHMEFIDTNTPHLIKKLQSKGMKVVIATDNMDTFGNWTVPTLKLGQMFDDILASDKLGVLKSNVSSKKSSKFFGKYLTQQSINPGESALIDNSLNNQSVEQYGINFLHVNDSRSATDYLQEIFNNSAN